MSINNSFNNSMISVGGASMGGTPFHTQNKGLLDEMSTNNTLQVEPKKIFHPFAEKPSPFEEFQQALILFFETIF